MMVGRRIPSVNIYISTTLFADSTKLSRLYLDLENVEKQLSCDVWIDLSNQLKR